MTVMLRLTAAVCGIGDVESVTVTATVTVPAELGAGVPVMAPVELLIESPLGRLLALYAYGVTPPVAVTALLYAVPTVPFGSAVVVTVSGLGTTGELLTELHPMRNPIAPRIRHLSNFRISSLYLFSRRTVQPLRIAEICVSLS
jgi:hypothetical protein